jgi:hypothetical protein
MSELEMVSLFEGLQFLKCRFEFVDGKKEFGESNVLIFYCLAEKKIRTNIHDIF